MSKLTRGKIAYDLKISPYHHSVVYDGNTLLTFMFSSKLNAEKFAERLHANREKINQSLSNRFNMDISLPMLGDIKLYSSIESRGFLIKKEGKAIECLNAITLSGQNMTIKS